MTKIVKAVANLTLTYKPKIGERPISDEKLLDMFATEFSGSDTFDLLAEALDNDVKSLSYEMYQVFGEPKGKLIPSTKGEQRINNKLKHKCYEAIGCKTVTLTIEEAKSICDTMDRLVNKVKGITDEQV